MKYLFLDIDGVLNTGKYQDILMESGQHLFDEDGALFDPEAIQNLEGIIEETDAKIVITSTWRLDGDMQALWKNRDLAGEVVGVTPTVLKGKAIGKLKVHYGHRGMEVEEWLQSDAIEPYNYAILDDEDDFLPHQANHLVLTNPYDGLTREIADRVIEILLR